MDNPMDPEGGLAVLTGSLAPTGGLIKPTAASESLMTHEGRAVVFEDHDDLFDRIDDPDLDVTANDVLVMRFERTYRRAWDAGVGIPASAEEDTCHRRPATWCGSATPG